MYWTNLTSKVAGTYLCRRPCMVLKAMAKDILKYIPERDLLHLHLKIATLLIIKRLKNNNKGLLIISEGHR